MKIRKISGSVLSVAAILIIMAYQVYVLVNQDNDVGKPRWQDHKVISWDVREYYAYLPATFIYHDPAFTFLDTMKGAERKHLDMGRSPTGKFVGRFSIGMAMAYSPFFFLGDAIANKSGALRDGFSQPYQFALYISGFIYSIIGFIFLAKALRLFFNDGITAITLLCIGLGTNLFYYTTSEGAMTHAILFTLLTIVLYYTILWHRTPKIKYLIGFSLAFGFAVLIRPSEILTSIIFLFYGIKNKETLREKLKLFQTKKWQFLFAFLLLILMALPQMLYWKHQTGSYIYYSYNGERFFFLHPRILKGLFSYRKGWFLYTPIMLLAMAGFVFMRKYVPLLFYPVLIFLVLNIYVLLSWWCWWYGGGFGLRAFIDSYAFLALPLAALWAAAFKEGWIARLSLTLIAGFFTFLNLFQSEQYRQGMLHWDSMSKKLYWATFLKYEYIKGKDKMVAPPNYEAAKKGLSVNTPLDTLNSYTK